MFQHMIAEIPLGMSDVIAAGMSAFHFAPVFVITIPMINPRLLIGELLIAALVVTDNGLRRQFTIIDVFCNVFIEYYFD